MPVKQTTLDLSPPKRWGGKQPGAGRPRVAKRRVIHHIKREEFCKRNPVHITFRVHEGIPKLRTGKFHRAFKRTLAACAHRNGFRVIHYSIQNTHVHCLIEADGKVTLGNGMKSLGARFSNAVNRVFKRKGSVMEGRYHVRVLTCPREVRNALAYVLLNARKHFLEQFKRKPPARIDPLSSGIWFDGWKDVQPQAPPGVEKGIREVTVANNWLLATGWRRHRLIRLDEVPGCLAIS